MRGRGRPCLCTPWPSLFTLQQAAARAPHLKLLKRAEGVGLRLTQHLQQPLCSVGQHALRLWRRGVGGGRWAACRVVGVAPLQPWLALNLPGFVCANGRVGGGDEGT